jgi:hypothetical protein
MSSSARFRSASLRRRIWTHAHGSIQNDNSGVTEAGVWLRLRDTANTKTLAVSVASWEGELAARTVSPLQTGGLMLEGSNPGARANPYTAAPGSYLLQLVVRSQGGICGQTYRPTFGSNQCGAMGFMLVGALVAAAGPASRGGRRHLQTPSRVTESWKKRLSQHAPATLPPRTIGGGLGVHAVETLARVRERHSRRRRSGRPVDGRCLGTSSVSRTPSSLPLRTSSGRAGGDCCYPMRKQ